MGADRNGGEGTGLRADGSPNSLATVTSLPLDLSDRFAFNMECTTDELLLIRWELHRRSPFTREGTLLFYRDKTCVPELFVSTLLRRVFLGQVFSDTLALVPTRTLSRPWRCHSQGY